MSLRFPGDSKSRSGFPSPSTTAWTFVLNPPRLRPSASPPPFCAAAMLVDLDCGAVQHQGAPIHNVLGNQFLKNMLPNTLQAPPAKPGVHTFPRAIPFRQVPPRYSCIQPIQDSIEHYPIVFSGSSAMRRLFWRQQLFHFIPLFFCQFMSLHTSILLLLP